MPVLQLVERHLIHPDDPRWSVIDRACFLSKNLYNAVNYLLRQTYIFEHRYLSYECLADMMKTSPDYCALPRKVSQWVLKQVHHDWQAFFAASAEYEINPAKFKARPSLPAYKAKLNGRNLLVYTAQAVSRVALKQNLIEPSQLPITIPTKQQSIDQVRIVPRRSHYIVEVVYTVEHHLAEPNPAQVASLDLGIDNLAALTTNQPGFVPLLVNGRPLKSINQFYNKEQARLQSQLPAGQFTSLRLEKLTDRRNRQVDSYLHLTSRRIVDRLVQHGIGTLIIGKNDGWKQHISLGRRTNQTFVQIPHTRFIQMLRYKAELEGMKVIVSEESYTSKCSFLDLEPVEKREWYAGRRVKRWLFVASDGREIHADINGSYNIMRKVIPTLWMREGIGAAVVQPVRITPYKWLL